LRRAKLNGAKVIKAACMPKAHARQPPEFSR
jgi:hypothetical protein